MEGEDSTMSSSILKVQSALEQDNFHFVDKRVLSQLTSLSEHTFKSYRRSKWLEGVHWVRLTAKTIRYNWPLIRDWLHNQEDPEAHQRAIANYQAQLLSNQKRGEQRNTKSRKRNP